MTVIYLTRAKLVTLANAAWRLIDSKDSVDTDEQGYAEELADAEREFGEAISALFRGQDQ